MVWAAKNLIHFYKHESCGKCTPCREGVDWLYKILDKIERGDGEMRDIDLLLNVCNNIGGKTLCPFGDAEIAPVHQHHPALPARVRGLHPDRASQAPARLPQQPRRWARTSAMQPVPIIDFLTSPITIAYIVLIHVVFFALQISAAVLVLAERKVAAFSQQRLGPYRVGPVGRPAAARRHPEAALQGGAAAQGGRLLALLPGAGDLGDDRVRGLRGHPVRAADRLLRPAAGADQRCRARTSTSRCWSCSRSPRWASTASSSPAGRPTASTRCSAACARRRRCSATSCPTASPWPRSIVLGNSLSLREIVDAAERDAAGRPAFPPAGSCGRRSSASSST